MRQIIYNDNINEGEVQMQKGTRFLKSRDILELL